LAWAVEYYGTTPEAGGVLDQSVKLTTDMQVSKNVWAAFDSMVNTKMDQQEWSEAYPTHWKIVARTQRLRMEQDKNDN
jgi:hypothetical protein